VFEADFRREFGRPVRPARALPERLATALRAALAGGGGKGLRFDLGGLSEFEQAVLRKALEVPAGQVRSYTWVAREIGRPAAVRAVGSALARNPLPLLIPCHRIVRSDGRITGYIFGGAAKRVLLRREGVDPAALERLSRRGVRYVGSDTTRIYCFPTCRAARRIAEHHRVPFRSERQAATAGYRPCRLCRPALAI
jgi:O-6-methylguanine DNA methyltransferase